MTTAQPYNADGSLVGKVRRRLVRLRHRRPARLRLERPTVSFTFDDVPASGAREGGRILEAQGARGTWYVCAGLFDTDGHMGRYAGEAEIGALAAQGHEIACHTFSHLDCGAEDGPAIAADAARNVAALGALGLTARHFAYPYGEVSPHAKATLDGRYGSLRAVHRGLVRPGGDLNQLPAVGIEGDDGEALARLWIDRAAAERAWVILFTHDVRETPSPWGCTPAALERLIVHARQRGCDIRTVGQVLDAAA